jgi:hypothetical protein
MKILAGHISPETAYVVEDYPYGFTLRCKMAYWLEFNKSHGVRLISQTTNPKRGHIWNKPKASTYCRFGGCMFLDDAGHVQWSGLTEYTDGAQASAWLEAYGAGNHPGADMLAKRWVAAKLAYDAKRSAGVEVGESLAAARGAFLKPEAV